MKGGVFEKFRRKGWSIKEEGCGGVSWDGSDPKWIFLRFE